MSGEHSSAWCAVAPPSAPFPLCHRPQEGTHGRNSGCVCPERPETGHGGGDRGKRGSPSSDPGITEGGKVHPLHVLASATPARHPFLSVGVTPPQSLRCEGGNKKTWVQTLHSPGAPALLCQAPLAHIVDEPEIHSVRLQDRC